MNLVWERYPGGGSSLALMLACADHSHDDGMHMRAGIPRLARKIRMSERQTKRLIQQFNEEEWLILVKGGIGRNNPNHYRMNIEKLFQQPLILESGDPFLVYLNSDKLSPLPNKELSTAENTNSDKLSPLPNKELSTAENTNSDNLSPLNEETVTPRVINSVTGVTQTVINLKKHTHAQAQDVSQEQNKTKNQKTEIGFADIYEHLKSRSIDVNPKSDHVRGITQSLVDMKITLSELDAAISKAERIQFKRGREVTYSYLATIAKNTRNEIRPTKPKKKQAWWETSSGIEAKAVEVSVTQKSDEAFMLFKIRVFAEAVLTSGVEMNRDVLMVKMFEAEQSSGKNRKGAAGVVAELLANNG